jgi:membrane protein required for colicin V production
MNLTNPFDIGIAVILAFCLIRGFFRGFIKEVFSVIGALGGFYCASAYFSMVSGPLSRWLPDFPYINILSFMILFLGVFFLISLFGVGIKYLVGIVFLRGVDRLLGAVFGALKGILIVSILLVVFTTFLPKREPMIQNSKLSPRVILVSEMIVSMIPKEVKHAFSVKIKELNKIWKSNN